jgi:hypothetical protein
VLGILSSSAALAKKPIPGAGTGGEPAGSEAILPLSAEQQASRDQKEQLIANTALRGDGSQLAASSCPTPTGSTDGASSSEQVSAQTAGCYQPYRFVLAVYPRQQQRGDYCGPAVAQIVSNFSWGLTGSANKYSQATIASWAGTSAVDCTGDGIADAGSCLGNLIWAMNQATRRPSGFAYMQKHRPTFTAWHNTIISGVFDWRLPLAAGVRPWTLNNQYRLISWTKQSHGGHYIELHGYEGYATSASRYVFYSDTAGAAASGTAAGNWQQSSNVVYITMMDHHGNMIY